MWPYVTYLEGVTKDIGECRKVPSRVDNNEGLLRAGGEKPLSSVMPIESFCWSVQSTEPCLDLIYEGSAWVRRELRNKLTFINHGQSVH